MTTVTVDRETARMGQQIVIRTAGMLPSWTGDLLVGPSRHFAITSASYSLKVSPQNGFNAKGSTDLYLLLTDSKGYQIPVSNQGRFRFTIIPNTLSLDRLDHEFAAEAARGALEVTAPAGYEWSVGGATDWLTLTSPAKGAGNGTIAYNVAANKTNGPRSATLTVGDATFQVTQLRPAAIQLPYQDSFDYGTPPPSLSSLFLGVRRDPRESPIRWYYDEFGQGPKVLIRSEGPKQAKCLVVTEARADPNPWATAIILPAVNVQDGADYQVSAWMKAENPGPVVMQLGQRTAPFYACGLARTFAVSKEWAQYKVAFQVKGEGCAAGNNRFMFQVGKIKGTVWIADFAMAPAE